jgi:hypothetical protein
MTRNRSSLLLLIVLMLLIAVPTAAQDADEPSLLRQMFGYVPAARVSLLEPSYSLSYTDYELMYSALEGLPPIETTNDFMMIVEAGDDAWDVWLANSYRINTGLPLNEIMFSDEAVPMLGFSLVDVDQAVLFGQPPAMGLVMHGDFNFDAVHSALRERGYEVVSDGGVEVYCPEGDCSLTTSMDLGNRNPANPFGGTFGRREAFALVPDAGLILNSADAQVVMDMLAAGAGTVAAAADEAAHTAMIAALELVGGQIAQVQLVTPQLPDPMAEPVTYPPMAPFALGALVDRHVDASSTSSEVVLIYPDTAAADGALEGFMERMLAFTADESVALRIEAVGSDGGGVEVLVLDDGRTALRYAFLYPYPEVVALEQPGPAPLFRVLITAWFRRALAPIVPG